MKRTLTLTLAAALLLALFAGCTLAGAVADPTLSPSPEPTAEPKPLNIGKTVAGTIDKIVGNELELKLIEMPAIQTRTGNAGTAGGSGDASASPAPNSGNAGGMMPPDGAVFFSGGTGAAASGGNANRGGTGGNNANRGGTGGTGGGGGNFTIVGPGGAMAVGPTMGGSGASSNSSRVQRSFEVTYTGEEETVQIPVGLEIESGRAATTFDKLSKGQVVIIRYDADEPDKIISVQVMS